MSAANKGERQNPFDRGIKVKGWIAMSKSNSDFFYLDAGRNAANRMHKAARGVDGVFARQGGRRLFFIMLDP